MKFTPGPTIAAASGSIGGTVYSRNQYGAYTRNRAIPVTSTTPEALAAKSRFTAQSQAWLALTAGQRLSWAAWALQNPVIDALGQPQVLAGNAAFIRLNSPLAFGAFATLTSPPTIAPPASLITLVLAADIGLGDVDLTYTPTPLGANVVLAIKAAVTNSTGINYVRNLLKLLPYSPLAQASPFDIQTQVEARLGTLVVGQTLHVEVYTFDSTTGLRSQPLRADTVVTTT